MLICDGFFLKPGPNPGYHVNKTMLSGTFQVVMRDVTSFLFGLDNMSILGQYCDKYHGYKKYLQLKTIILKEQINR